MLYMFRGDRDAVWGVLSGAADVHGLHKKHLPLFGSRILRNDVQSSKFSQ